MKQFFKWIGKHIAGALVFSLFSILFIAGIVYALTYPSAPPTGEVAGGKFMQYFNLMLVNTGAINDGTVKKAATLVNQDCGSGKALQGFDLTGSIICANVVINILPVTPTCSNGLYWNGTSCVSIWTYIVGNPSYLTQCVRCGTTSIGGWRNCWSDGTCFSEPAIVQKCRDLYASSYPNSCP